jgi:hypothetical protein
VVGWNCWPVLLVTISHFLVLYFICQFHPQGKEIVLLPLAHHQQATKST